MNAQTGRNHWAGTNEQQNEREQADSGDQHTVYWYVFYILLAHGPRTNPAQLVFQRTH
jgi:hypothetical protein